MPSDLAFASDTETRSRPAAALHLSGRPVLLASDGSDASRAAARVAHALAAEHHAEVHVVHVVDSRPAPMPPPLDLAVAIADATIGGEVHAEQVGVVREAIAVAVGEPVPWPVRVMLGTPAHAIVQEARRLHAALIVTGLRRHGRADRAFHDETALEVMRRSGCAVLGVAADLVQLPTKVMAALDFSLASLSAARAARAVMDTRGTLVLAYVPAVTFDLPDDGEAVIHRLGVEAGFAQCRAELQGNGIRVDQVVLHREARPSVAEMLLQYAEASGCDLIATGSARRGRLDRLMLGSVSTELVRDGRRSVLLAPPRRRVLDSGPD